LNAVFPRLIDYHLTGLIMRHCAGHDVMIVYCVIKPWKY